MDRKFWNWVRNEDTGQRTLYLEGVIAQESWFGDEVTPEWFKNELHAGDQPITVHINSVGGDCIAASRIYTMLMEYPADVTVEIDGVAASAASVVAMAGTKVCMSPTALMMIHNPWTSACGDTSDMQKAITLLDEVKESIINAYEIKTGMDRGQLSELMNAETWMNAYRAQELGFCDEVLFDGEEPLEKVTFSYSGKAAVMQLMNMVRASLPAETEEPAQLECPMDDYSGHMTGDGHEPLQPEPAAIETNASTDDTTEANTEEPVSETEDRVSVADTDTRLEHLRY